MRKIRKFKIAVHFKDILRRVRASNTDAAAAGFPLDSDIAVFISSLHAQAEPGVVYEFIEGPCMELTTAGVRQNAQCFSVCAVTLGPAVEEALAAITNPGALTIANIAVYEFLRTAVTFISDLVKQDADKEDFTVEGYEILSSPVFGYAPEPKFLREAQRVDPQLAARAIPVLLERLNSSKISVSFEGGKLTPKATIIFMMPWQKKKGKK